MSAPSASPPNLELLFDIPVQLTVQLGASRMCMREVLQLGPGAVVQLDRVADDPVDLYVNDKLFARGEVVVIEDQLGIRITELVGSQKNGAAANDA
jgi:flagellar motor switch protein FliN/FliY